MQNWILKKKKERKKKKALWPNKYTRGQKIKQMSQFNQLIFKGIAWK